MLLFSSIHNFPKFLENRQGPMQFPITVEALPAAVAAGEVLCPTLEAGVATEAPAMIRTF